MQTLAPSDYVVGEVVLVWISTSHRHDLGVVVGRSPGGRRLHVDIPSPAGGTIDHLDLSAQDVERDVHRVTREERKFADWLAHVVNLLGKKADELDPRREHNDSVAQLLDNARRNLADAHMYMIGEGTWKKLAGDHDGWRAITAYFEKHPEITRYQP